jgi:hypothetical protein
VWDAFWIATGFTAFIYKVSFRKVFGLETGTVEIDGEPTEVVRPIDARSADWVLWCVFILTPSAACLDGCGQSTIPT